CLAGLARRGQAGLVADNTQSRARPKQRRTQTVSLAKRFDEAGEVLFGNETRRRCRQHGQLQTGLPEALDMGTALIWCSEYIQLLDHLFGKSRLCHRAISSFPVAMYF